jgi:DNA-binding CsgD family transcriptional regulator
MIDEQRELSTMLANIYDAAGDASLWAPLIEALAGRTKSHSAALVIQAFDQDLYAISNSWRVSEEFVRAYREHYHRLDTWAEVVVPNPNKYPGGDVCTSESLCPLPQLKKKEFYNDHLAKGGIEHALLGLVENNKSCVAAVALYRDKSGSEFGEPELKILRFLAPHLRRSFNLYRRFLTLKSRTEGIENALDILPTGVIFVDFKGDVILMNRTAAACVAERDGLLATPAGLRAELSAESIQLQKTIQEATATSSGNGSRAGGTVVVSRRARPPLGVQISPIRSSTVDVSRKAAAVAFVTDPLRIQRPQQETLRMCYGLTAAECRVALLLSDGGSPREISDTLGISENTVRTQIKSIFSKTGVHRQSELIRLLVGSAGLVADPVVAIRAASPESAVPSGSPSPS